jgi:hypothetical protein
MNYFVALALFALPSLASAQAGSATANSPDTKAVMATLESMAKATIEKDVGSLNRIYGDELSYAHSSGLTETKAQVVKNVQGPGVAEFMKFNKTDITVFGDVAVAKSIVDFRTGQPGQLLDNHLDILFVMVRRPDGPHGWQIVARHALRIGPSRGTPVPAK